MAGVYMCPCGCGSVIDPHVAELFEQKNAMVLAVSEELAKEKATNAQLRDDQRKQLESDPFYPDAVEVFEHWKGKYAPRAKELGGERLTHLLARLRAGHTAAEICRAVDASARRPWKGAKYPNLTSICRSEDNLLMFLDWADADAAKVAKTAPALDKGSWQRALQRMTPTVMHRLERLRGWTPTAITELGLGLEGERVLFPLHDASERLVGLGRYAPNPESRNGSKMLAEGARELFPAPETIQADSIWLVEGEPDAVAMWSIGQPAVAVPGVQTWKDGWTERFARFERVRICFDCDPEGREAADKRSTDLSTVTDVSVVELDASRTDHYDVGDLVLEMGESAVTHLARLSKETASDVRRLPERAPEPSVPDDGRSPLERVTEALEARDCRPRESRPGQLTACCPNHSDRHASLSVAEGDDRRVLLTCHAGCDPADIVRTLGLEWREMFAA